MLLVAEFALGAQHDVIARLGAEVDLAEIIDGRDAVACRVERVRPAGRTVRGVQRVDHRGGGLVGDDVERRAVGAERCARLLESAYKRAAALRPEFDQAVRRQLQLLSTLEQAKDPSMDRAADSFAVLLSSAAEELTDPVRKRIMEQLLYHLGRWIYLIDGADDLKKDAESGNYNPVALRYGLTDGVWTPESRRDFATTLDHSIHQMAAAFELWDFGVWTPVLQSTFYGGLFQVGKAVLDGRFHRPSRKNIREFEETE